MLRIVALSDTHNLHSKIDLPKPFNLPGGDVLIHAGDISNRGSITELYDFCNWIKKLDFPYKIIISGNHDWCFQNSNKDLAIKGLEEAGCIYLQDSGVLIKGIYFYGSPFQPEFCSWAFNLPRGQALADKWNQIPAETNVLITHGPPRNILDTVIRKSRHSGMPTDEITHQGCDDLAHRVKELPNLKAHVFGHLHQDQNKNIKIDNTTFYNVAICDEQYKPVGKPTIIEL